jgi:hypothetical protein
MKFTGIIVLLLLLSFSASAGTFLETFDDKDLEGWEEIWADKGPALWEVVNDELRADSREAYIHLLTTGDSTWEDYTMELDVKPLKKHGIGGISIAVRVQGTWLVYCSISDPVIIIGDDPPFQEARIGCFAASLRRPPRALLFFEPHPLLRLNRWAHLKLSVEGNIFTFWLNGEQVMEPTELLIFRQIEVFNDFPDFRTGGVGFGLWNYTAVFDNITVTGDSIPNSGGFAVTPQGKLATTWGQLKQF